MSDVTQILKALKDGDTAAASQLWTLVYDELHRLAAHKLAQESAGQTLQPTALVHEAYLRLVGDGDNQHFDGALTSSPASGVGVVLLLTWILLPYRTP